jgi:regulator of protease activity HflC (stomatin/prohibitin superfamily)
VRKANTVLNIVPQGERHVVERLGKLHTVQDSGWYLAIPFIDNIAYIIDMRERALDVEPQSAVTRDNVRVDVTGVVYIVFNDPEAACYGAANPLYSVVQHAQSAMRSAIGEMELDEIFHNRNKLNESVMSAVQEASKAWGIQIKRYEITDVRPDRHIADAMDKQAAAERNRREKVLEAEGDKRKATLESEGVKIRLQNESEGKLIAVRNEAEAESTKLTVEAEGLARAMVLKAQAQAEAIRLVSEQITNEGGETAAKYALAVSYSEMMGEIGKESNTMFFEKEPGNVNALLAKAGLALEVGKGVNANKTVQ